MRIAIIGSGISGLVCAHYLQADHDVTLFEAERYAGGHTATVEVNAQGRVWNVDTGFIVYNDWTYPNFIRFLDELEVATQPSRMSFSVRCERTGLEYNGTNLNGLFAQRANLVRPAFHRMLRDIFKLARVGRAYLHSGVDQLSLNEFLRIERFSREFIEWYIVPMGAAIWSAPPAALLDFPAHRFLRFFENHGMLNILRRPTWRVVQGGSARYVEAMLRRYRGTLRLNTPVRSVRREASHVQIETTNGLERFDQVILATHCDTALRLLRDPTPAEREVLGAIPFQANAVVLHTDARLLPTRRRAWAAWNYHLPAQTRECAALTYNMNILQSLDAPEPFLVTLNYTDRIDPARILRQFVYHHPVYHAGTLAAQARWAEISGQMRTHFCGAYWSYGFHEDGVKSGLRVIAAINQHVKEHHGHAQLPLCGAGAAPALLAG